MVFNKKRNNLFKICIEVIIEEPDIVEGLPDNNTPYDEQTLEDWYDFASSVENIVDNLTDVVNISLSKSPDSLSEYIDFYVYDEEGNKKNYLIDMRLSDHGMTTNGRNLRRVKARRIDSNVVFKSIVVNNTTYSSYSAALAAVRRLILNEMINGDS